MTSSLIDVVYLVSSGLMLAGIWQFLSPGRTQLGNLLGGAGVLLAILATLTASGIVSLGAAFLGLGIGCALGAFVGLRANSETAPAWIALLVTGIGLSSALVAGAMMHHFGAIYDARIAQVQKEWEGIPESVKRDSMKIDFVLGIHWTTAAAAAIAAAFGGLIATSGAIAWLKLTKSTLRKSLPKLEEPRMPQMAFAVVCVLLGVLLTIWPGAETFFWLLLLTAMGLGYVLTIHLKIVDVPPVLAATVAAAGLSLAAAGTVITNTLMVTAGALVASGAGVVALSLCRSLNVSLLGLLRGTESSKTANEEPEPVRQPLPGPATANP
jgi:H+-translocating NAD(P) transhydrogenase subunit beta